MDLIEKVKSALQRSRHIKPGTTVIVGVSGGADSVALLLILNHLRYELGIHLRAAHFNHRLRREATRDERFVGRLAESLGIPFISETRPQRAARFSGSLEENAREWRLDFFSRLAKRERAIVALAHTSDDLAETVLMRLVRGAGLLGLRGILPERSLHGMTVIRPFLDVSRREVEAYLKKQRQTWCHDVTNDSQRFFRNKVRLKLLPLLRREFNPAVSDALVTVARHAAVDYDFLETAARKHFTRHVLVRGSSQCQISCRALGALHPAQRQMLLRLCYEQLKGDLRRLSFTHIMEIDDLLSTRPAGARVDLPAAITVVKRGGRLVFQKAATGQRT